MARAKAEGHRVVLVLATRGELGEFSPDALAPGETLTERRVAEAAGRGRSCSASTGSSSSATATRAWPASRRTTTTSAFARADIEEAAARARRDCSATRIADVLTVYDNHGGYGHPDHIQVHRVGVRAAELAGTKRVYESTMNRDYIQGLLQRRAAEMPDAARLPRRRGDGRLRVARRRSSPRRSTSATTSSSKRAAMAAHASQIPPDSFFLAMPADAFREAFGRSGSSGATRPTSARPGCSTISDRLRAALTLGPARDLDPALSPPVVRAAARSAIDRTPTARTGPSRSRRA